METPSIRSSFSNYVLSSGKLNELQQCSSEIDRQLLESRIYIQEIKNKYKSINNHVVNEAYENESIARHEEIANFLESGPPKLLPPDMNDFCQRDVDLKPIMEKFRKKLESANSFETTIPSTPPAANYNFHENNLDIESFSKSLQEFCNRLSKINSLEHSDHKRNAELESKLEKLCEEADLLSKMVQSKMSLSQSSETWSKNNLQFRDIEYTDTVKKLLDSINELTFMSLDTPK